MNMENAMFSAIHHVSLLVSNEACVEFYKKLGFTEYYRKQRNNDIVILLDGYGMQLEIFVDSRHPVKAYGNDEPMGIRHFALKTDDIVYTAGCLEKLGINVGEIGTDWNGVKYCYIKDPDGNLVEVHE